ncbi:uncharacterized protein LOC141696192 [Apium graveolens]|uniref:uncharacterized protein LOC141696192 n=1 Tax=Apium graveolens TaxID=4045 RepID=UPI003D7A4308
MDADWASNVDGSHSTLACESLPRGCPKHYNSCSMQNPSDYDYLVAHKHSTGLVIVSRSRETCVLRPVNNNLMDLIGSINGLPCLGHQDKLWLWNPAIHQSKELALWSRTCWDKYGFGFDPVSNDYKVVVLVYQESDRQMSSAFVYSSNSETWTRLHVPKYVYPCDDVSLALTEPFCPSSIVKDCP